MIMMTVVCSGCMPNVNRQLDDQDIRLLMRSRIRDIAVLDRRGKTIPMQRSAAADVLSCLIPIIGTKKGNLSADRVDFTIIVSAGREPFVARVDCTDRQLCFQHGNYLHWGGDKDAIVALIDL
jgi:hypothetical protein